MPTAAPGEGLYIAFEVAQTRELTRFVKDIPPNIGEPLDFGRLSSTAMYPEELGDRALSREERRKLPSLVRKIHREFGHISIVGSEMYPAYGELVAHKKFAAIAVDPPEELIEARSKVAEIVSDEMGIHLPRVHPKGWHVSVARRQGRGERLAPYSKPFPTSLVVSGVHIAVRGVKGSDFRYINDYTNRPRNLRRR